MQKEIFEQPTVITAALEGRLGEGSVPPECFGPDAEVLFQQVKQIHIVACGTSYHAGMVARYWLERYAGVPVQVEVASEYRYRTVVVPKGTLFVTLSQSGETADTLAALRFAREQGYLGSLAICNVPGSSLVRESDLTLMTQAGPEIGVASTKAFTTQLTALMLLTLALGRVKGWPQAPRPSWSITCAACRDWSTRCWRWTTRSRRSPWPSPRSTTRCSSAAALTSPSPWKAR